MCGISGEIRLDGKDLSRDPVSFIALKHSLNILAPRGPDDGGMYRNAHVSLGHRILRIYDRS